MTGDGVRLNSTDNSHVSYPMGNSEFGYCPSSHPKRFISLFYEAVFNVQKFPYRSGAWVYSFGDNTGNGFHADFISGWDVDLLSQAIVQCNLPNGGTIDECAPLKAASDQAKANACKPSRPGKSIEYCWSGDIAETRWHLVLNEDYGLVNPIKALPGDNPVWSGTGPKPSCQCFLPYPAYISPNSTLSPGYSTVGVSMIQRAAIEQALINFIDDSASVKEQADAL